MDIVITAIVVFVFGLLSIEFARLAWKALKDTKIPDAGMGDFVEIECISSENLHSAKCGTLDIIRENDLKKIRQYISEKNTIESELRRREQAHCL